MSDTNVTSGSTMREAHTVRSEKLQYSLELEQRELESQVGRTSAGRTAKTLAKTDTLRVTLVHLTAGNTVNPAATAGAASLQLLKGPLAVEAGSDKSELGPGELLILSQNLREPLHALEDSTFLVTVAWEEGAGAWEQEERHGQH